MVERRKPIPVNEAIERVMQYSHIGKTEFLPIEEAYGRFLAEDLIADHDVPFFDRSPYDGFAIRAEDTANASREEPVTLNVVGEIGAGSVFEGTVKANEAVRIMTGAAIPEGCNAVCMLELVEEIENGGKPAIRTKRSYEAGDNISFKGEDTKKGSVLAEKGTRINPGIVALLATFGYKEVPVSTKPTVGIISTGSELLEIDEPLQPGKIRNSNAYMIRAQVERAGGVPIYLGQFSDDFDTCYQQVIQAIDQVDFLVTTGGVSVGDYDYLPAIYEKMNANVLFNKVGMRPGSVTTVAEKDGKLLFGLSGNPSACYVGFELFLRPIIRAYLHHPKPYIRKEQAVLGTDFSKPNPFDRFVRGQLRVESGKLVAEPAGLDKSNVVSSLGPANVLILLPKGTRGYEAGMEVNCLLLEDEEGTDFQTFTEPDPKKQKTRESSTDLFQITEEPIDLQPMIDRLTRREAGAVVAFEGIVREWTKGKRTLFLEYQAYKPMALKMLQTIGDEIRERWPDTVVAITHRIGRLEISDIAVAIVVTSPHRKAAYEANQYAIDRIKQIVPIWKKEHWENGEEWLGDQLENVPYPDGKPTLKEEV